MSIMRIRVNPFTTTNNGYTYFKASIWVNNKYVAAVTGTSLKDARKIGEEIAEKLRSGEMTVEQLKNRPMIQPQKLIHGKTMTEWAERFGVTSQAIYKAARKKKITVAEEIRKRLSPSEWPDFDSKGLDKLDPRSSKYPSKCDPDHI